jgi:hypothetical protein
MRKWRKMTWALWIWSALIIAWAVLGAGASNCTKQADQLSQDACTTGAGIGVLVVLLIGFFGFVFLSLIWFMTRPRTKTCPRCGEDVKKGTMRCRHCEYDFASAMVATPP